MLKYGFITVTSTIHTECNKSPSCTPSEKMQPFQKPQISRKRWVRSSRVKPARPATQEGFAFRQTCRQAAYPLCHHSGRPQPHTVPSCPFPLCCYHLHLMSDAKPAPCRQAQCRVPDGGLGGGGVLSLYILPDLPPTHSSMQKYPCSYQRFWS